MVDGLLKDATLVSGAAVVSDGEQVSIEKIRGAALDCLRRWRTDDQAGRSAMAIVIAGELVINLSRLEDAYGDRSRSQLRRHARPGGVEQRGS